MPKDHFQDSEEAKLPVDRPQSRYPDSPESCGIDLKHAKALCRPLVESKDPDWV